MTKESLAELRGDVGTDREIFLTIFLYLNGKNVLLLNWLVLR
jgi:hypothetical protein